METEEENEDLPFHVYKPTTSDSQATRHKPKVTFRPLQVTVEQNSESEIKNTSSDENNKRQTLPQSTTQETIPGNDLENSESEQITEHNDEPERFFDADHESQTEPQQDSDVPTGRENRVRRPPVRFGIDEINNKYK